MSTASHSTPVAAVDHHERTQRWRHWAAAHPVAAYAILAYALSWTLWVPAVAGGGGVLVLILFFAGALGPAGAALIVTKAIGAPVHVWARQIVKWRVPVRYYVYALGLPALLFAVVNVELALAGQNLDLSLIGDRLPAYLGTFLLVVTIGGGLEEPGWRGFALPRLQAQHTPVKATLILGLIWGGWHLPLYGLGAVGPIAFVFFYTWLCNRTGSVLLCILLHASFTPALDHLVLREDSLGVDLAILTTLVAAAVALVALTKGRLGYDPSTAPADLDQERKETNRA
ncbi:MAG TPA: type II CAAX endopeptidase family protein [Nocardioides sp.]|uniref:CPBP family intramembrane glutamic endopeptidase n=1 Tax=Nocardioides sp. TaxID=35761 RepID=UPI002E36C1AA|nr:type II CAAX endopeptidase family protein [Nocardioides sp.]HEX5088637.1 type II CAAX endopeptidase family protein [Nocardioides sp.]